MLATKSECVAVDPRYGVGVPPRQEVIFRDGGAVWLHQVLVSGMPDLFKRRIEQVNGEWAVIDLRKMVPGLHVDLPATATRDVPGTVHFSLRCAFPTIDAFRAAVRKQFIATEAVQAAEAQLPVSAIAIRFTDPIERNTAELAYWARERELNGEAYA